MDLVPWSSALWPLVILSTLYCGCALPTTAQSALERLHPGTTNDTRGKSEDLVKVVSGTKVKRFDRLTVPLTGHYAQHPVYYGYTYIMPQWQASAKIVGEGESTADGVITFQQLPYNNDIKVTINITGLPPGRHALHVHTYGDLSDGCKSTGGQFPNNFIGNVDTKEDGSISAAFRSVYLNLFGFNGIVGRSIVVHEKPIDLNTALNAEVFSSSLQAMPDALAYQNEENSWQRIEHVKYRRWNASWIVHAVGYRGACASKEDLEWALRVGGCSWQFKELLNWLEARLLSHRLVAQCTQELIQQLRASWLQIRTDGDLALSPHQFRWQMLQLLLLMLRITQRHRAFDTVTGEVDTSELVKENIVDRLKRLSIEDTSTHIDLDWVIIDCTSVNGAIDDERWQRLEHALVQQLISVDPPVRALDMRCERVADYPNVCKISCSGVEQVLQLLTAISRLPELWPHEDLCALPWRMRGACCSGSRQTAEDSTFCNSYVRYRCSDPRVTC